MSLSVDKPFQIVTYLGYLTASSDLKKANSIFGVSSDNSSFISYNKGVQFNSLTYLYPFSGYLFNNSLSTLPFNLYNEATYVRTDSLNIVGSLAIARYHGPQSISIASSPVSSKIVAAYSTTQDGKSYVSYLSGFPFNSLTHFTPNSGYIIYSTGYPYTFYDYPVVYDNLTIVGIFSSIPSTTHIEVYFGTPPDLPGAFMRGAASYNGTDFNFYTLDNCLTPLHMELEFDGWWYIKIQRYVTHPLSGAVLQGESHVVRYNTITGQLSSPYQ